MNWYKKAQINGKEPWQLTQQDFMDYHYTGFIESNAYEQYRTTEGLNWLKKSQHPELYSIKNFGKYTVEFRRTGENLQYVKHDKSGNIMRDEKGDAKYLSQQEMIDRGLALKDQSIVAFIGEDAIGWVSNEFGATGVWVVEEYQKLGIGSYMLFEFRKTMKPTSKIGQMTESGINLVKAHHKKLVEEALNEGKEVPQEVLNDYPELQNENELV